ncbi:MAG: rRNA adenine N-6-methyltransferase family protein [Burkholderiaceae bacterium]
MRHPDAIRVPKIDEILAFVRGFLRDPAGVGSVIPSSRFMERRIVGMADVANAKVVVELGPGTGGTTRALLAAMPADSKLVCIEIDQSFVDMTMKIDDPRLIVHKGSAEHIVDVVKEHGLNPPDVVVSGIPFSTMPPELGRLIVQRVHDALPDGGKWVAYQLRPAVAEFSRPVFGIPERDEMELLNVPPYRLYRWRRS